MDDAAVRKLAGFLGLEHVMEMRAFQQGLARNKKQRIIEVSRCEAIKSQMRDLAPLLFY